jgi:hypothetical protein
MRGVFCGFGRFMARRYLLKPFPVYVHMLLLGIYFLYITGVNVFKFGWGHLLTTGVMIPVMLCIILLNRNMLRNLFSKRPSNSHIGWYASFVVVLFGLGFVVLYGFPNKLATTMMDQSDASQKGLVPYGIDFLGFYLSFAFKGVCLAGAEMLFNVGKHQFYMSRMKGRHRMELRKEIRMRTWISHFMGNLAQSLLHALRKTDNPFKVFEAYAVILTHGTRVMSMRGSVLVTLEQEIYYLKHLRSIYRENNIQMDFPEDFMEAQIIPMLLLDLYKNMYKHGDFQNGQQGLLQIECIDNYITIKSTNKIANSSLWMYGDGGSGLGQLEHLLRDQFGGLARIAYYMQHEVFYLMIEIPITYEHNTENFSLT